MGYREAVDGFAEKLFEQVIADAGATVAFDVAFWALIAFLLSLCFAFGLVWLLGNILAPVNDRWSGTWRAVMYLFFIMLPSLGATVGAGEGAIRGVERAIRTSAIGQKILPTMTDAGVGLYAIVYTMDPGAMGSATSMMDLTKLSEIRSYTEGREVFDAGRLQRQVTAFRREGMPTLMENRQNVEQLVDFFGEDYRLAHDTVTQVFEQAERASNDPEVSGPLDAMFDDMSEVAAIDGEPETVTRAELAEHLTDRVIIPTIMAPVKAMIRPWQIIAGVAAAILLVFTVLVRVLNVRQEDEEVDVVET